MVNAAVIGTTYYMGNTFNAEECTVNHIMSYSELNPSQQRTWDQITGGLGKDPTAGAYVCFASKRKHDQLTYYRVLPVDVFCACAHESFEAMVSDRARADVNTLRGMPGAYLPGEVR